MIRTPEPRGVRHGRRAYLLLAVLCAACAKNIEVSEAALSFRRAGRELNRRSLRDLAQHAPPRVIETDDPYYHRHKHFRALPLAPVLEYAFGQSRSALRRESFVLHARDGYAVSIQGERLLEEGAYIAFDDVDFPGFEPIGPQRVSPAPAYLAWTGMAQRDLETHPRPWQLVSIEIAPFASLYPHTLPPEGPEQAPARLGFALFRDHCIKCHAINREGGRVGPDLNVPLSIVEYRPLDQIRAYIKDPESFRYGAMPAHPNLRSADLDALIAYFQTMAAHKYDPAAKATR